MEDLRQKCLAKVSVLLEQPLSSADVKNIADAIRTLNETNINSDKKVSKKADISKV